MKVKRYRAATMREALERVKHELGEDALVLDSKRVRAGGILGLGAVEQIEVRVTANPTPTEPKDDPRPAAEPRKTRYTSLSLTDGEPARPEKPTPDIMRPPAYAQTPRATTAPNVRTAAAKSDGGDVRHRKGVEPHTASPALASRAQAGQEDGQRPTASATQADTAQPIPRPLAGELKKLHAELRELKFSFGIMSARTAASEGISPRALDSFEEFPEIYDSPYFEFYMELTGIGLPQDVARRAVRAALTLGGGLPSPESWWRDGLSAALTSALSFAPDPLAPAEADAGRQPVLALIGPTGVGKTTTLAKLAARTALRDRRRVEMITLDTYRIAAVEQLKTYAEIIGAGFHVPRSVLEMDALIRRLAGGATLLIDTVGRSPHDLADQLELADYLRANEEITKCLVLQATTHPTDALASAKKFALYGANVLAFTKLDETARPGAFVGVAAEAALPLAYICAGQRVPEDIEAAAGPSLASRVLRDSTTTRAISETQPR